MKCEMSGFEKNKKAVNPYVLCEIASTPYHTAKNPP
jgi:hypothetical protein